ncbi:MAG: GNAT family N-acetyltransferase [Proteobacteria bacterium]|nr:GNAT family N-acetyltransferase [Pseudomonadota bacterium]MDA0993918.1 GNAT family N-acetyltransferase [Pseudomonadota bacterium]
MLDIHIRDATPADQPVIASFNSRLAAETEGKILDEELIGHGVAALLADRTKGRYWLADIDGQIAGQMMVTYEWSDWRNGMLWWIQSVYVPAKFRRRGVFSAMYEHVASLVRADKDACGIRLYVEKSNLHAQDTYRNLGMIKPGYEVMESILPGK